jgi:hypothetical protein
MRINITVSLVLAAVVFSIAANEPAELKKDLVQYGTRSAATISVIVGGPGIDRPGVYHIDPSTELIELVRQAGFSKSSKARITVIRRVDGYDCTFGFKTSDTKEPPLPSFRLLDRDYVHVIFIDPTPEKPNKEPEPPPGEATIRTG